jgi:hypothetical protein
MIDPVLGYRTMLLTFALACACNFDPSGSSFGNPDANAAESNDAASSFDSGARLGDAGIVVPSGLVGYWPLDETSGQTAFDLSGNELHGTITGPVPTTGAVGGARLFDGADDFIGLGNPAELNLSGQISTVYWINYGGATNGIRVAVAHGYTSSPQAEVAAGINAGQGTYYGGAWNGTHRCAETARSGADDGQWILMASVYDGTTWRLYRNAVEIATLDDPLGAVPVPDDWAIGARGTGTERFFDGAIDDVRIYDRPLSVVELELLFAQLGP